MWSSTGHKFSCHQHTIVNSSSSGGRNECPTPLSMLGYVLTLAYTGKYFKTQERILQQTMVSLISDKDYLDILDVFQILHHFLPQQYPSQLLCLTHLRGPCLMMLWDLPPNWLVAKTSVPIIWSLQRVISQNMIQGIKLPMKHQALHDLGDKTSHL